MLTKRVKCGLGHVVCRRRVAGGSKLSSCCVGYWGEVSEGVALFAGGSTTRHAVSGLLGLEGPLTVKPLTFFFLDSGMERQPPTSHSRI